LSFNSSSLSSPSLPPLQFLAAARQIENLMCTSRESLLGSGAWRPEFLAALKSRPFYFVTEVTRRVMTCHGMTRHCYVPSCVSCFLSLSLSLLLSQLFCIIGSVDDSALFLSLPTSLPPTLLLPSCVCYYSSQSAMRAATTHLTAVTSIGVLHLLPCLDLPCCSVPHHLVLPYPAPSTLPFPTSTS
jgi:Domain of unknown function (DUF4211)